MEILLLPDIDLRAKSAFVSARVVLRFFPLILEDGCVTFWRKTNHTNNNTTTNKRDHVGEMYKKRRKSSSPNDTNDDGENDGTGIERALLSQRFEQQRYRLYEWSTCLLFFRLVLFLFFFFFF
jgi:hypothetical protein